MGSRRACEELVRQGRVTINGREALLGDRVDPARDRMDVDGVPVPLNPELKTFAFHKPRDVTSTLHDERARSDLSQFLPEVRGLVPVGRLDRDSEGLLILTNDGDLANRLMHPRYEVEKEYLAEVRGTPTPRGLGRLTRGVELEDGIARAASARLGAVSRGRAAVRIVMAEGRKREVRRMLAAVGFPVTRLVRVRVGPVRLGRLEPGQSRELTALEVRALHRAANG
jgi:23S rRNA pseudouridine2605 synthase